MTELWPGIPIPGAKLTGPAGCKFILREMETLVAETASLPQMSAVVSRSFLTDGRWLR